MYIPGGIIRILSGLVFVAWLLSGGLLSDRMVVVYGLIAGRVVEKKKLGLGLCLGTLDHIGGSRSRGAHRSIMLLESAGYTCTRAAASMGCCDIIGISPTDVVLVQVKTRDWPGSVEMEMIQCPPLCRIGPQTCRRSPRTLIALGAPP